VKVQEEGKGGDGILSSGGKMLLQVNTYNSD
jgi:hypothetical protein